MFLILVIGLCTKIRILASAIGLNQALGTKFRVSALVNLCCFTNSLVLYEKFGPFQKVWSLPKSLVPSEKFDMKVLEVAN